MDATAEAPAKDQSGQAELAGVLAGGGGLDAADFGDLIKGDRPAVLQDP
jgi:hypothetical protein